MIASAAIITATMMMIPMLMAAIIRPPDRAIADQLGVVERMSFVEASGPRIGDPVRAYDLRGVANGRTKGIKPGSRDHDQNDACAADEFPYRHPRSGFLCR